MKHPSIFNRLFLISVFLVIHGAAAMAAGENGKSHEQNPNALVVAASHSAAGFRLPVSSTEPVIEYRQNITMLTEQDLQPKIQVFTDGRVRVHYPVYMKKAGDYEFELTWPELIQLIQSLSANGLMDFDQARVKQEKKDHDLKMKAKGELHYVSDAVVTLINIRLLDYQKTASSPITPNLTKYFSWGNLEQDAKYYKNNHSIQSAAKGIKTLDNLTLHKSMKKVK
jgi:hypothetical protein